MYLDQIGHHNHAELNSIQLSQWLRLKLLIQHANIPDEERTSGKSNGPLQQHTYCCKGDLLPDSELGMDTTYGSFALVAANAKTAPILDAIRRA